MKRVGIISKPNKPEVAKLAAEIVAWLRQRGYEVIVDPQTELAEGVQVVKREQIAAQRPEFVIVLGGDGTLLAAARAVAGADIPILGVNLGSLGFMTEVTLAELYPTLEAVIAGKSLVENRALLECELVRGKQRIAQYLALNEIVVSKTAIARLAEFDVLIDGAFVSNYKADALIVSTPTGSTAYSLAAGGPILEPDVDAFVITPVSPHALTNRPLVVRDSSRIVVKVTRAQEEISLTVDGQVGMPLQDEDEIVCCRSQHVVKLLRLANKNFFDVLRTKLKWGER